MKRVTAIGSLLCAVMASAAFAQEHYTEGPVWECSSYRTKPGHFDDYMKYLRENFLPTTDEGKKQGLLLDRKVFLQPPSGKSDWDVMICTLFPTFGKAMDYSAADEDKWKAIEAKHYSTTDEKKQEEMASKRFDMREFIGTSFVREVSLKPIK